MATFAGAKPGSGKNFAKLKSSLAARGARNPGALAAYIGRRKYGRKRFARLGHSHSNLTSPDESGLQRAAGAGPGDGSRPGPVSAGQPGLRAGTDVARRLPVRTASDVVLARGADGAAVLRHRAGGTKIGEIRRSGNGYQAVLEGSGPMAERVHQRTAVQDLIGGWNGTSVSPFRREAVPPLLRPPQQTDLMRRAGVPAIRALATPATSSGGGPRMAAADGDRDDMGPRAQGVYRKLRKRGFPHERARNFAKRAANLSARKAS